MTFVAAAAGAAAALALTPWLQRTVNRRPAWLRARPHVPLAAAGAAGAWHLSTSWSEFLTLAVLALACALLVVCDLVEHRLPNAVVLPMYPILFFLLALTAAATDGWQELGRAFLGSIVLLAGYFGVALAHPKGMGLGDVKLSGLLGLFLGWFGWHQVMLGTLAAFVLNGLIAIVVLAARRTGLKSELPFGPSMIAGAALGAAALA